MFGNILNGIPVIGHAKAVIHYLEGDKWACERAMYAANRSTAVVAGGAAGIIGGPAGMVAGATGAGLAVDAITSAATGRPRGVIEGVSDIVTDIGNGDIPVRSVLKTGLCVGADALSGFGGGAIAGSIGGTVGKSVVKDAVIIVATNVPACQMIAAGSLVRGVAGADEFNTLQLSSNGGSGSTSKPGASGSGSQPPNQPNNNKKDHQKEQSESHLAVFLRIFNVSSLDDVIIRGVHIFRNLAPGQLKALKNLIKQLRLNGLLTRVVKIVVNLFNKLDLCDINFQNFLSLGQFVAAYIGEQVAQRNQAQRATPGQRQEPYEVRRQQNLDEVSAEAVQPRSSIYTTLMQLYSEIRGFSCTPSFRNIFSAIYHYFKHKSVPQSANVMSVSDYFNTIQSLLQRVRTLTEYAQLTDTSNPRRELVFDRVIRLFGQLLRIRIVLKIQDGNLELSSCYIIDDNKEYDEEGVEFIDPDKKR